MESKSKHSDETESCYETEYALLKQIHFRDGEILKLEHINAKYCREIERYEDMLNARVNSINESLKSSARLAFAQEDEIKRLNTRISTILETTPDVQEIQSVKGD